MTESINEWTIFTSWNFTNVWFKSQVFAGAHTQLILSIKVRLVSLAWDANSVVKWNGLVLFTKWHAANTNSILIDTTWLASRCAVIWIVCVLSTIRETVCLVVVWWALNDALVIYDVTSNWTLLGAKNIVYTVLQLFYLTTWSNTSWLLISVINWAFVQTRAIEVYWFCAWGFTDIIFNKLVGWTFCANTRADVKYVMIWTHLDTEYSCFTVILYIYHLVYFGTVFNNYIAN